jgi:hypothetical protein
MSTLKNENRVQPLLICGAAGSGKSHYIQEYARQKGLEVLVCPCRIDRTLREQRTKLHEWAHRLQPSILWLEGADDLTPEAQSFLRRILETYSPSIHFILECRSIESIQEPIKSRCIIKMIHSPTKEQLLQFSLDQGLTQQQFQIAFDQWPKSKHTWRQFAGLKFIFDRGFNVDFDRNQWNKYEKSFNEMTIGEKHDYLKCRYIGGNPFAFSALLDEMKKDREERDGK